jgi:hypothetical protein
MMNLLSMFRLGKRGGLFSHRSSKTPFFSYLPVGGVIPVAAYLAWRNRDKIRSLFDRVVHHHHAEAAAAAA